MKSFYAMLILSMIFLGASVEERTYLEGVVTDVSGEVLIGVNVLVKNTDIGTSTDVDGKYRLAVPAGKHKIVFAYTGFTTKEVDVEIKSTEKNILNLTLEEGVTLDEVVVTGMGVKKESKSLGYAVTTISSSEIRRMPTAKFSKRAPRTEVPAMELMEAEKVTLKGSRVAVTEFYVDGIAIKPTVAKETIFTPGTSEEKVSTSLKYFHTEAETVVLDGKVLSKNFIPMAELNPLEVIAVEKAVAEFLPEKKEPKAGQLTAGEWNDLDNWKEWKKLNKNRDFRKARKEWQFDMSDRFSVVVENRYGQPLVDIPVTLMSNDEPIWNARTDNLGKAELWANVFKLEPLDAKYKIVATFQGEIFPIKNLKNMGSGKINKIKIDASCETSANADILFAVDATGSMGDEIAYLKSEIKDVISQVQKGDHDLNIRLGSVFYRDTRDAYLTRQSPLSSNIQQTVDFINNQNAGGGGDFPEAVDAALIDAIEKQNWSEDAVARIVFLVLDAPPHQAPRNLANLKRTIQKAAAQGIKIIPVTASGINKSTEFLMKFFATATNGTYVFITDDSGIGNAHLKPTAKKYDVEFLNELLVRLIEKYTDRSACEDQNQEQPQQLIINTNGSQETTSSTIIFKDDPQLLSKVKYFPNPATDWLTLELQDRISAVSIINSNGQEVLRFENLEVGSKKVELSGLAEGFYLIRFQKDRSIASGKLVVIKP